MSEKPTPLGLLVLLAKLGAKFGAKAIPFLLKIGKLSKLSWIGSLGVYAVIFNWKFALMLIGSLFVHEYGHVWAMKREGMAVKGMYFIPFLGAAAVGAGQFPSRAAEVRIALMGPLWGLALAALTFAAYLATGEALLASIAGWMAMVNLFNLLPIMPLDGGRVFRNIAFSFSGWIGVSLFILSCVLGFWLSFKLGLSLIILVLALGFSEAFVDLLKSVKRSRRLRVAQDLAPLYGIKPRPWAVFEANHEMLNQLAELQKAYRCGCDEHLAKRDIDLYDRLKPEPIRGAVLRGWQDFLRLNRETSETGDESDWRSENLPALTRPLEDLIRGRVRDAAWLENNPRIDILQRIDSELSAYDEKSPDPLRPANIAWSALGYVGLTSLLFVLLYSTKHVPGAEAAFDVFKQ